MAARLIRATGHGRFSPAGFDTGKQDYGWTLELRWDAVCTAPTMLVPPGSPFELGSACGPEHRRLGPRAAGDI